MSDWVDIDPAEMGPDSETNKGRAIRDCATCGHSWSDHECWPTHIDGGGCFHCTCDHFTEREASK